MMRNRKKTRLAIPLSALVMGATGLTALPAIAADEIEEIVVTGSNIHRRQDFVSTSPVQTIGELELKNTAAVKLQDVFRGLTVNSGSQTSNRQNSRQGISQFSLRGLGIGSTLTLVNGRRGGLSPVTDDTGQLFTDANQFPVNMIQRIEVLTDGASATYGSEAVAGVVNIITRSNFEGFELTGEIRDSTNRSYNWGAAFGAGSDRGHVTTFVNYYTQDGNYRGDFDFINDRDADNDEGFCDVFCSGTGSPGNIFLTDGAGFPDAVTVGSRQADPDCVAAMGFFDVDRCRYNFINQRRLIAEEERFQAFSQMNYDLTDRLKVFGEVGFSRNKITDVIGGAVMDQKSIDGGFFVAADNPYNFWIDSGGLTYVGPEAWVEGVDVPVDVIVHQRPVGKAFDGDNAGDIVRTFTNLRIVTGFDWELNNNWNLNFSYMTSTNDFSESQARDYDLGLFQAAIDNGSWNPFGTAIANPMGVSPRDGVSVFGNTGEALDSFALTINTVGSVTQEVAEAVLSGDTGLELGGGSILVALGTQLRWMTYENIPDSRRQNGTNARAEVEPLVRGDQDVYALYAEAILPILDGLTAQLALRYEDYGDQGGSTTDPKVSIKYDVSDQFAVRASWGTSFQAPSIRQINGAVGNDGVEDLFGLDALGGEWNVGIFTSGADDLTSQSAENYNVGAIWSSEFGLSASVDYWNYEYKDLILPDGSAQSIVDGVGLGVLPADRVQRNSSGQLRVVFANFLNRGDATASGVDLKLAYSPDFDIPGDLVFDLSATIITQYDSSEFGDIKGSRNSGNGFGSTPDQKINGGVTYNNGGHGYNLSIRYIGSYTDDQRDDFPIDSQVTLDARYDYTFSGPAWLGSEATWSFGVINLTDETPPPLRRRPLFDTEVHDPRGRQLYAAIRSSF